MARVRSLQGMVHNVLGLGDKGIQVLLILEALGVDLVDLLGTGPATLNR